MNKLLLLPITLPLRLAELQLRLALGTAEWALQAARGLAEPFARPGPGDTDDGASPFPAEAPALPEVTPPEPAALDDRAAVDEPPAPEPEPDERTAVDEPPAPEPEPPRARALRTARKATADQPARRRASGPTRGEVAAIREANREAEGTEGGPGPELHVDEPWEGYAEMRLDEVLARLEDASDAELAVVRMYETQHENRQAILLATEEG